MKNLTEKTIASIGDKTMSDLLGTYQIPKTITDALCLAGQSSSLELAVENLRREWDHYAVMCGYVFYDYQEDISPLSIDLDVYPDVISYILRRYNVKFGMDVVPVYDEYDLLYLDEKFQQKPDTFMFDLVAKVNPTYVMIENTRYKVEDNSREICVAVCDPVMWEPNFSLSPFAAPYTTHKFNLRTYGFAVTYSPFEINEYSFEIMLRNQLNQVCNLFATGEGQERI